jgi:5-methyltetrahydrofolate--homocysteine methyltransferase
MNQKIVLLDGASGTSLWKKANSQQPVWKFNVDKPEIVVELEKEYIAAGSQIILTNTFAANRTFVAQEEGYDVKSVVQAGVRLSAEAVKGSDARVMLDVGPLGDLMEPYGMISEADAEAIFDEQIGAAMTSEYAPKLIFIETFIDLNMLEVAVRVAEKYDAEIFCSMSFADNGFTIMGNSVDEFAAAMERHSKVRAIGLNCNLTPGQAMGVISQFAGKTTKELLFKPNAGQPRVVDGVTVSGENEETFVSEMLPAVGLGVKYMGGCCGTAPSYISLLKAELAKL